MKNILALILLTSCSTMIQSPKDKPKYAPAGYQATGKVKYLNRGMDWIINQRRESAFKEMHESCGGDYKVTRESLENHLDSNDYMFIEFVCIDKAAAN